LVFDGRKHVRIANLPGMWERTLTAQSAGSPHLLFPHCFRKLISSSEAFAATGWRVGWIVGPPELMKYVLAASTRIVFAVNTPLQIAAAVGLEQAAERKFFEAQLQEYEERKDILVTAFDKIGLPYTVPEGAYFTLMVRGQFAEFGLRRSILIQDISKVKIPEGYKFPSMLDGRGRGYQCVRVLILLYLCLTV
jgi:kynurenine aminotransferase